MGPCPLYKDLKYSLGFRICFVGPLQWACNDSGPGGGHNKGPKNLPDFGHHHPSNMLT